MIRPEVLRKRLQRLDEYLGILERLRRYSKDQFLSDPERYGSAERFLQLSIEAVNDMGSYLIAELALGEVDAASDIPKLLRSHGNIDQITAQRWTRMVGFRNILLHDYLELSRPTVYGVLQENLGDLSGLRKVFAEFL